MSQPTVFIIDDDPAVRDSLECLIGSVGLPVATYASADEFLEGWSPDWRGCLVTDVRMPGMSGLELQEDLRRRNSRLPVIFITGHGDVPMAVEGMKGGALDFVQKPFRDQELLDRIHEGLQEERHHHQETVARETVAARLETLTPREKQVMEKVVVGAANKVIAMDLGVSQRTVEIHRARVMEKMRVRSLAQLVQMMSRFG